MNRLGCISLWHVLVMFRFEGSLGCYKSSVGLWERREGRDKRGRDEGERDKGKRQGGKD